MNPLNLTDRFETLDGSRPHASVFGIAQAKTLPLSAFTVLGGGDVSDARTTPNKAATDARRFVQTRVTFKGGSSTTQARVATDLATALQDNINLALRMCAAKPIAVDIVASGIALASLGYPNATSPSISGLYWDDPEWPSARIAIREERLASEPVLVFHEMAHAIHSLAFSEAERDLVYRVLQPTFGNRSAMDEVFAIYSEQEIGLMAATGKAFDEDALRAPGIYGATRRQWSEDHVFTRFVRKLYRPSAAVAGPKMAPGGDGWMRGLGRRG